MQEFKVNEYITLKLEKGKTNIYVNGELFKQCKFLLLNIPVDKINSFDEIESIDKAAEKLDRSMEGEGRKSVQIPAETEFFGHCSNLQVWVEDNYNTRLLHRTIAFPLLKKLSDVGEPIAKRVFKEEIAKKIESGNLTVIQYLINQRYLDYLNKEELDSLFSRQIERGNWQFMIDIGKIIPIVKEIRLNMSGVKIKADNIIELSLYDQRLSYLPESIGNLSSLEYLDLSKNQLLSLPESIGNLFSLQELYLGQNKLKTLPESISNLRSLQTLSLWRNQLSSLPESIGNLKLLKDLRLRINLLTTLPESIGDLKSLEILRLQQNNLTTFPESIGNLSSLKELTVYENQLTTLPESISNLISLQTLNLRGNQLSTFPESITKLTSLQTLDLGWNRLTTLPESIKILEKRGVKIFK